MRCELRVVTCEVRAVRCGMRGFKSVVGGHRFEYSGQRSEAHPGLALFLLPWFQGPGAAKTNTAASPHHAVWLCVCVRVGVS